MSIKKLLVVNPNASPDMTELVKSGVDRHLGPNIVATYWTCPEGPTVLKSQEDIELSTRLCLENLKQSTPKYDSFLLACYADHPLTAALKVEVGPDKPVVGIFEASINAALDVINWQPLPVLGRFAIMTTGKAFEKQLSDGVTRILGDSKTAHQESCFAGVISTGIVPGDTMPEITKTAKQKVQKAVQKLMMSDDDDDEIVVVCMGGVILYGLEDFVLKSCQTDDTTQKRMIIIDQLEAGVDMIKRELEKSSTTQNI
ncbi:hypothetical protein LTS17_006958 [Exophiala oligosperma]